MPNPGKNRLILASTSPRRRELLAGLGLPFEVMAPDIPELPWPGEAPASFALRMAHEKAQAALAMIQALEPLTIIAADTIVVLGREILGKPADAGDAMRMLQALSGRQHTVITGLCVWRRESGRETIMGEAARTGVLFRHLTPAEIHHYVASGEPMDKAGAYAIQGGASGMIEHIEGSYSNVVGLPMEALTRLLDLTPGLR